MPKIFQCGSYKLSLDRPHVMAIINMTPDSFSGDGFHLTYDDALKKAENAVVAGASILDVGGESSRPGAESVSIEEEIDRVVPLIEKLIEFGVPVSIDTMKPEVMLAAIQAGACIVNDINALQESGAVDVLAGSSAGVCLMHMQGKPRTMQHAPQYHNVVMDVRNFLQKRADILHTAGIEKERIVLDVGFGFGKTFEHNAALFRSLPFFQSMRYPLLVGVSRKSMLGHITGKGIDERMIASVTAALLAIQKGASIVRVHDAEETCDAIKVWQAIGH